VHLLLVVFSKWQKSRRHGSNKKLSCRREAAWHSVSLKFS